MRACNCSCQCSHAHRDLLPIDGSADQLCCAPVWYAQSALAINEFKAHRWQRELVGTGLYASNTVRRLETQCMQMQGPRQAQAALVCMHIALSYTVCVALLACNDWCEGR